MEFAIPAMSIHSYACITINYSVPCHWLLSISLFLSSFTLLPETEWFCFMPVNNTVTKLTFLTAMIPTMTLFYQLFQQEDMGSQHWLFLGTVTLASKWKCSFFEHIQLHLWFPECVIGLEIDVYVSSKHAETLNAKAAINSSFVPQVSYGWVILYERS